MSKHGEKAAALMARAGYGGAKSERDTTHPTVGPIERPGPLERARGGRAASDMDEDDIGRHPPNKDNKGYARGGMDVAARARGGRSPKHSTINVVVAQPPAGGASAMPPRPPMMPPRPPMAPPGAGGPPPGMPPGPAGLPPGAGGPAHGMMAPPGVRPPGMKRGGGVSMKAGAASGPGRLEKTKAYGGRG